MEEGKGGGLLSFLSYSPPSIPVPFLATTHHPSRRSHCQAAKRSKAWPTATWQGSSEGWWWRGRDRRWLIRRALALSCRSLYLSPSAGSIHDHMLVPEVNVGNDRECGRRRRDERERVKRETRSTAHQPSPIFSLIFLFLPSIIFPHNFLLYFLLMKR